MRLMRRVFLFLVLVALVGAGYLYLRERGFARAPGDLGSIGRRLHDAKVAASVRAALGVNRDLAACDLSVSTEDGVVTLRGFVPDAALRVRASSLVAAVPGVRQVVDHLRISAEARAAATPDRSLGESLDDRSVEMRVRLALSLNRSLEGAEIDVAVYRRAVTLAGEVSAASQAKTAVELARETAGVASVVDHLRVQGGGASAVEKVRRALKGNPNLARYGLSVRERESRLELGGRVATAAERELAGLVADKAAGRAVENRITVGR
jgi:hyperosmotically inducible protein